MINFNTEPKITAIEYPPLLAQDLIHPEKLLMKIDGNTLRITQRSWFSIKPSQKKIFDEIVEISRAKFDNKLITAGTIPEMTGISIVEIIFDLHARQIGNHIEQLNAEKEQKNERFITKIIKFISEYFGWRLFTENKTALEAAIDRFEKNVNINNSLSNSRNELAARLTQEVEELPPITSL